MQKGSRDDVVIALSRAMKKMEKIDRFIFYLRIESGMKIREIAEVVGYTPDRTSCRLKKIYAAVRKELEG